MVLRCQFDSVGGWRLHRLKLLPGGQKVGVALYRE
jgi:hypothetical protein